MSADAITSDAYILVTRSIFMRYEKEAGDSWKDAGTGNGLGFHFRDVRVTVRISKFTAMLR